MKCAAWEEGIKLIANQNVQPEKSIQFLKHLNDASKKPTIENLLIIELEINLIPDY